MTRLPGDMPGDGAQDALSLWNAQKDDLLAGREPWVQCLVDLNPDGTLKTPALTLRNLCHRLGASPSGSPGDFRCGRCSRRRIGGFFRQFAPDEANEFDRLRDVT